MVVDSLIRGRYENISQWDKQGKIRLARIDLAEYPLEGLLDLFLDSEIIIHMASRVSNIEFNSKNHYLMYKDNVEVNTKVIDAARYLRPYRFAFVSTSCVYQGDVLVPTPESAADGNPEETNYGYGLAKWVGEKQCEMMCKETLQSVTIARFWNAYGNRDLFDEQSSHVIPALIKKILDGQNPLIVWGSGLQTRTFVHASDLAFSLLSLIPVSTNAKSVNIGHSQEISVLDLAKKLRDIIGKDFGIQADRAKPNGYERRSCDASLLKELTGIVLPIVDFDKGLSDAVAWYRSHRGIDAKKVQDL
jgi:nucleoside-diphosphate-sugar epimerase